MPANSFKVFVVDDEYQSRNLLCKLLSEHFPEIVVAGQASSVKEGLEGIRLFNPNLLFLDIAMQGESGFDLLQQLDKRDLQIIFVTAHDEYALKAFRFNAVDYLLKPIVLSEMKEAISKAIKHLPEQKFTSREQLENLVKHMLNPKKNHDKIAVPTTEDNGIGRTNAALFKKQITTDPYASKGIYITIKRLMGFNGNNDMPVLYEDMLDSRGQAAGTRVIITLRRYAS
jgi:YesN/AraC family two-component response regulator